LNEAANSSTRIEPGTVALGFGEQLARDARARIVAASGVVLVHTLYPPGHPALLTMGPATQVWDVVAYTLAVTFPVHLFVLLSFLNLAPRVRARQGTRELVRTAARRLVPAHLFWVAVFFAAEIALSRSLPSPAELVNGVLFGTVAAHLYFTPLLLALIALSPLLFRAARMPSTALLWGALFASGSLGVTLLVAPDAPWARMLTGIAAMAPFAIAGLAFADRWGGLAPPPHASPYLLWGAGAVVLVSAVVLAEAVSLDPTVRLQPTAAVWLANVACALGIPLMLMAAGGTVPRWALRFAPLTLGVYFVHPLFIVGLRKVQARVPALEEYAGALVPVNTVVAIGLSLATVWLLARTPLRRVVT